MSAIVTSKINPRAVMQLQKEFSKPFASKALAEFRKDSPKPFSPVGSKAQLSNTAPDQQAPNSQPGTLSDMNGSNVLAFVASNKLLLEESLRKSTQRLNVGNLLIEKAHIKSTTAFSILHEDL